MPESPAHDLKHSKNEVVWHVLMEQITPRTHEDPPRFPPMQRLFQFVRQQNDLGEWPRRWSRSEQARMNPFSVAVLAARPDLGAAFHGIPCRLSPFDCRLRPHHAPRFSSANTSVTS